MIGGVTAKTLKSQLDQVFHDTAAIAVETFAIGTVLMIETDQIPPNDDVPDFDLGEDEFGDERSAVLAEAAGVDRQIAYDVIAASVVDLPEPVGPVTSTRPRGRSDSLAMTGGSASSWNARTFSGIRR